MSLWAWYLLQAVVQVRVCTWLCLESSLSKKSGQRLTGAKLRHVTGCLYLCGCINIDKDILDNYIDIDIDTDRV